MVNRTVWKFPFEVTDRVLIQMSVGAEPLFVAVQNDQPCLWARIDPTHQPVEHTFRLSGTGHDLNEDSGLPHVGSFMMLDGQLVFHLFGPKW